MSIPSPVPIPVHIPMVAMTTATTFQVPYWLGGFAVTTPSPATWTLPLTYDSGGKVQPGEFLQIRNYGPGSITLQTTSPETIDFGSSYVITSGSIVKILSNYPNWVLTAPFSAGNITCGGGMSCSGNQVSLAPYGTASTCSNANVVTDMYGRTTCTSNPTPVSSAVVDSGIYLSQSGGVLTVGNNGASKCPLDNLSVANRALVLSNTDYSSNSAAVSAVTSALTTCMGNSCYLPAGRYYISASLVLVSNTVLIGAGRQNTFIYGVGMSSLPAFTCGTGYVANLKISNLYIGGIISMAMDFSPTTAIAPYASKFEYLTLVGGTSHAYYANSSFENYFDTVGFQTTGIGYGCVSSGNKEIWTSCSLGPFGSNSSIGIKTDLGGTFINVNALYFQGSTTAAKVYEFGVISPALYPRVQMIGCNFESWGVTAISLLQQSLAGIEISTCTFQPLHPTANIRSYIDDIDGTPNNAWGVILRSNTFFDPIGGFNTTANPTSSMFLSAFAGVVSAIYFEFNRLSPALGTFATLANSQPNVYRHYAPLVVQQSASPYTGSTNRIMMPFNYFSWSAHSYVNFLNVLGGSTVSTLAAGTTVITLPSSLASTTGRRMYLKTANTGPTTLLGVVLDFYANVEGTFLWLSIGDAFTTIGHNATGGNVKFFLSSGLDELAPLGAVYGFMYMSGIDTSSNTAWRQVYGPAPRSILVQGYANLGSGSAPANTNTGAFSTTKVSPTLQAFGAVTANAASGVLAFTVSTAAQTCQTAVVTNTNVVAGSEVILTIQTYTGAKFTNGFPSISRLDAAGSSAGSFTLELCNTHATNALSGNLYAAFWVLN
jgi:hypothetical protein